MSKRFIVSIIFSFSIIFLNSSFFNPVFNNTGSTITTNLEYTVSQRNIEPPINLIYLKKDFTGFKELLGFKESGGRYYCVNKYGYMGKYQFNLNTLKMFKIKNAERFLNNPELQEKVFLLNIKRNKWILRKDIKWFVGSIINGSLVTESGILAAAHLSGPGNIKKYLRGNGKTDFEDAFGTSISYYMNYFKDYDLSFVKGEKKPRF